MNLHHFWDEALIAERAGSRDELIAAVQDSYRCPSALRSDWPPSDVDLWTGESHRLAASRVNPASASIGPAYADQAWLLIRQRISAASERLALILDATLGPGEVLLGDR